MLSPPPLSRGWHPAGRGTGRAGGRRQDTAGAGRAGRSCPPSVPQLGAAVPPQGPARTGPSTGGSRRGLRAVPCRAGAAPRAPHTARRYAGGGSAAYAVCAVRGAGLPLPLGIAAGVMRAASGPCMRQAGSGAGSPAALRLYGAASDEGPRRPEAALSRTGGCTGARAWGPAYRPALSRASADRAWLIHVPGRRDGGAPQPAWHPLLCSASTGRGSAMQGAGCGPAPLSGSSPLSKDGAQRSVALPRPARQRRLGPPGPGGVPPTGAGRA